MYSISFSPTKHNLDLFENDFIKLKNFLKEFKLNKLELMMFDDEIIKKIPKDMVSGAHLIFWPMWIDFYDGNINLVEKHLGNKENIKNYYGSLDKNILKNTYIKQIKQAIKLNAKYVVIHISNVYPKESVLLDYKNNNKYIIDRSIEFINEVLKELSFCDIDILFENLWSNGLTFLDDELSLYFIESIEYKNKGFLLDLSHLIITNHEIKNENEACSYIKEKTKNIKKYIKGIHINRTAFNDYINKDYKMLYEDYMNLKDDNYKRYKLLINHMKSLDPHLPYLHNSLKEIIEYINPLYKNLEISFNSKSELENILNEQIKYLY
ncbi:TIM barrel protein [Peptostreptococcaceae bacterium AGR-M142]